MIKKILSDDWFVWCVCVIILGWLLEAYRPYLSGNLAGAGFAIIIYRQIQRNKRPRPLIPDECPHCSMTLWDDETDHV